MLDHLLHCGHREALYHLARFYQPNSYLEVGVREGDSLRATLDGCPNIQRIVLCDTWGNEAGGTGRGNHNHIAKQLSALNYEGCIHWLDGSSQELLTLLDGGYDIVHIDGDHDIIPAYQDLVDGWRLTNILLAVHDITFNTVSKALKLFEEHVNISPSFIFKGDTGTHVYLK